MRQHFSKLLICCTIMLHVSFLSMGSLHAQISDFEHIDWQKADSVAGLYENHALYNLPSLAHKLTFSLTTDAEKFRAIYKWVCENIGNDYTLYAKNRQKRAKYSKRPNELAVWDRKISVKVFDKLLKEHKTVCTGYAYLIRELANHAGLSSHIVHGFGRTADSNFERGDLPNHSWNVVKLAGKWYLSDATWSSGSVSHTLGLFIKEFDDAYFLSTPAAFAMNHYPLDSIWLLTGYKTDFDKFIKAPLVYKKSIAQEIFPTYPTTFDVKVKKGESVLFGFKSKALPTDIDIELQVITSGEKKTVHPKITKQCGNYSFDHKFMRRGVFIVHILVAGQYVYTHQVKVVK